MELARDELSCKIFLMSYREIVLQPDTRGYNVTV